MLKQQIKKDMIQFMKEKKATEKMALSLLNAAITNKEKEKGATGELTDIQIISIIKKQIKEHQDSLSYLNNALHKQDEIAKLETYIVVLSKYLPEEMPIEEAKAVIANLLKQNDITSKSQMGLAMKAARAELEGKIDNSKISMIVKELLK